MGPGDITDDELLPAMGDAMLGTVTAHFYSATHPSPMNTTFSEAYRTQTGNRPNFMAVSGYDGMHLIYEALKKTGGSVDGDMLRGDDERHELGKSARSCLDRCSNRGRGAQHLYQKSREDERRTQ